MLCAPGRVSEPLWTPGFLRRRSQLCLWTVQPHLRVEMPNYYLQVAQRSLHERRRPLPRVLTARFQLAGSSVTQGEMGTCSFKGTSQTRTSALTLRAGIWKQFTSLVSGIILFPWGGGWQRLTTVPMIRHHGMESTCQQFSFLVLISGGLWASCTLRSCCFSP